MALTSKQRAYLRSLSNDIDTVVTIGKGDISDTVVESVLNCFNTRELVKGKVLDNSMLSSREACVILAEKCEAEPVQVIGTKFVLYKRNIKDPRIVLPKE